MFKNASIFKITLPEAMAYTTLELGLNAQAFKPCSPSQDSSSGWVPPRGEVHGPLVENIAGHLFLNLMTETKSVPKDALDRAVADESAKILQATGRKPGRKETRELRENKYLEMLPMAFSSRSAAMVWIDLERKRLVIDATSGTVLDLVQSALVQSIEGVTLQNLVTQLNPAGVAAAWLTEGDNLSVDGRGGFYVARGCELQSCDENKATVRYVKHHLDNDEVRAHLAAGKVVRRLDVTYKDRVGLTLGETMTLRKLNFLDVVFDGRAEAVDRFDADAVLLAGELSPLIDDLIEVFGGEAKEEPAQAAQDTHAAGDGPDPLFDQAKAIVLENRKASISMVQRYLQIGYNRAAQLLEDLEKAGIVSPMASDGSRKILA